jgi:multicomponent Na+:H+ antiporter subunit B
MIEQEIINIILLGFLAVTAVAITRLRNLFAVAMLGGLYSLLSAVIFVLLDAVDVAFTEAAVGAGITTVLFLGTLLLCGSEEKKTARNRTIAPMILVLVTGGGLIYATLDPKMPRFGDPNAPATRNPVAQRYLADTVPQYRADNPQKVGIPNVVTTTLASYRGYDTLGEVFVIFTAGIAVLLLLGSVERPRRRRKRERKEEGSA